MKLEKFTQLLGEELEFFKGNGRAFAPTSIGTLYVSNNYNSSKPGWVMEHSGGVDKNGVDRSYLQGSLWLCNTSLTEYDIKNHRPLEAGEKAAAKKRTK